MLVKDIMQPNVVTASPATTAEQAFEIMREGGFRHLPIVDGQGRLLGIVSDRDLLSVGMLRRNARTGLEELVVGGPVAVESIMVKTPITVAPTTTVSRAVKVIREKRIGCVIVCEGPDMVGILSYLDVLAGAETERREPERHQPDLEDTQPIELAEISALRHQLVAELHAFEVETVVVQESVSEVARRSTLAGPGDSTLKNREEVVAEATRLVMDEVAAQIKPDKA